MGQFGQLGGQAGQAVRLQVQGTEAIEQADGGRNGLRNSKLGPWVRGGATMGSLAPICVCEKGLIGLCLGCTHLQPVVRQIKLFGVRTVKNLLRHLGEPFVLQRETAFSHSGRYKGWEGSLQRLKPSQQTFKCSTLRLD